MRSARAWGRLGWSLGLGAAWVGAVAAGCTSFGTSDAPGVDAAVLPPLDAPVAPIDAGDAGAAGDAGDAGGGATTVFVSPEGDDQADGRTAQTPLRTLGAALSRGADEIRVCKGRYGEPAALTIARKVALLGGYDCATFARPSGFPDARAAASSDPTETVLFKSADDGKLATLVFADGSAGASLEGFTVEAATVNRSSTAVVVGPKARVDLTDVRFVLGAGAGAAVFGVGLDVSGGAVAVRRSWFKGTTGSNTSGTAANLATLLNAGESSFRDNVFDPGQVSGQRGALHLFARSDGTALGPPITIERNTFLGGAPSASGGTAETLLLAVNLQGPVRARVAENIVRYGPQRCAKGCVTVGVAAKGGAQVDIERNLLDLGELSADPGATATQRAIAAGGGALRAENNVVLLATAVGTWVSQSTGLEANTGCVSGTPPCVIPDGEAITFRHNTVHTGAVTLPPGLSLGANVHAKHVTLEHNVFFNEGGATGVRIYSGEGATLDAMTGNVLVTPSVAAEVLDLPVTLPMLRLFADYPAPGQNARLNELASAMRSVSPAAWRADVASLDLPLNAACAIVKRNPSATSPAVDFLARARTGGASAGAFQAPAGAVAICIE
jgi:hypothetical protein